MVVVDNKSCLVLPRPRNDQSVFTSSTEPNDLRSQGDDGFFLEGPEYFQGCVSKDDFRGGNSNSKGGGEDRRADDLTWEVRILGKGNPAGHAEGGFESCAADKAANGAANAPRSAPRLGMKLARVVPSKAPQMPQQVGRETNSWKPWLPT